METKSEYQVREWLWPWNFRFHGNNTIHDISPPSVLLAFCICLIPIFVKIFIIFIAYHLRILRELLSLYFIMLEMTSVKTFYNQIPLRMHCSVFKECVSVLSFGFWVYSENISLHLFIPNKDICWSLLLSGAFHYYVWNVEAIKNSTEGHYVHNSRSTMMINRPGEYGVLCHIVQTFYRCCIFTTHSCLYIIEQNKVQCITVSTMILIKARHYSSVRRKYAGPGLSKYFRSTKKSNKQHQHKSKKPCQSSSIQHCSADTMDQQLCQ